ncbi:MAG: 23S rRNA (adenine(2030)-N(6))-methyltransferase RlmJ [Spirochaetaceae bacterium]|jgi:23S rRNA (adenine2030-N6)-methyltransferase|nr:23S rRNA (adenine(2030)-N(6))-methyltransferase RlmJ [Spirochaetaceae bacterium]
MLSYRHAFHAGNAPDVLKHGVLIFCLEYLKKKEKALLCIDTHGGAGYYDLTEGYAAQNREWEQGITPLLKEAPLTLPPLARSLVTVVREFNPPGDPAAGIKRYPGSPAIIAALLREQDRGICFELHPADSTLLQKRLPRLEVRREDGLAALKALLPPPSRRALVFIDPSYEMKDDYWILPEAVKDALGRFSSGCYLIWYPLLGRKGHFPPGESTGLPERLWSLYGGNRLRVELYTGQGISGTRGLYGSGLIIYNPPWPLKEALEESLPLLSRLLGGSKRSEKGYGWDLL